MGEAYFFRINGSEWNRIRVRQIAWSDLERSREAGSLLRSEAGMHEFHLPVRGRMPSLELIWNDLVESSPLLAGTQLLVLDSEQNRFGKLAINIYFCVIRCS